jgi:hypothetical protein
MWQRMWGGTILAAAAGFGLAGTTLSVGHGQTHARAIGSTRRKIWPMGHPCCIGLRLDYSSLGQLQGVGGHTVHQDRPLSIIQLNIGFSNHFHCSEFENTKPILLDVHKFPNMSWL